MVSAFAFFVVYAVGGLTFLPLCMAAFLALLFYSSPTVDPDVSTRKTGLSDLAASAEDLEPVDVYRAGWLTVRRTYEPTSDPNGGTYVGMLASGYRSFLDNRSKDPRRSKPKDVFYAVLKNHVLFLYESEEQAECWAAIEVSAHDVVIFPEDNVDGELFVKRTAIELKPKKTEVDEPGTPTGQPATEGAAYDPQTGKPLPWFLFAKVNSDKEDWYHSLILASRLNSPSSAASLAADRALFSPEDMARLVESIDSQPDSIPMRWFNAFLGRVFLTVYRTSSLEDYLTSRLVRKLKRVKLPSLLSEVQVREVNVGSSVPLFSRPMLKELTADGDASMEVHVSYIGAVRITISTVATFTLASRTYSVRLVLAVVLRELEGTLLVKMKRPPSNRIWFGFTKEPKMRIDVEPVVSARQIKWSLVTGPIESRIRELIIESLVLPHMDDLSFFNTRSQPLSRGGVYGAFLRKEREVDTPTSGAKGEDVVEKPPGGDEEDLLDAGKEEREGRAPSVSQGGDDLRQRSTGMRRRRSSSEGGMPGELGRTATVSSTATGGKSSSVKSSSSVSSGLAAMSASIANWRENRAAAAANSAASSPGPGSVEGEAAGGAAGGTRRKTSWFAKSSSLSTSSTPNATTPLAAPGARTPLAAPGARTPSAERGGIEQKDESSSVPTPLPTAKELKEKDEEALKRLNAVLAGGVTREEEKKEDGDPVTPVGLGVKPGAAPVPTKSNLSLTAPATPQEETKPLVLNEPSSDLPTGASSSSSASTAAADIDNSPDPPPALPPRHLTDSPLPLNRSSSSAASTESTRSTKSISSSASTRETGESCESGTPTAATTASASSSSSGAAAPPPPPLPNRDRAPSLIKTLPATPPSDPSDLPSSTPPAASPAPSTIPSSSLPPPPPPLPKRGHSPSPSLPHNAPSSPISPRQRVSSAHSPNLKPPGSPTFHSSASTTSSSAAGLLASWRSGAGGSSTSATTNTASGGLGAAGTGGLASLRSVEGREEAKEALAQAAAQGVREAKEKWGKWSASWSKKQAAKDEEEQKPSSSSSGSAPVANPPRTPERQRPQLPPRQTRSSSLSLSSSPSRAGAPFAPAPGSPATAAVSNVSASPSASSHITTAQPRPSSSVSPSRPSAMGYGSYGGGGGNAAGGGYKRASMMTLPGLAAQGVDQRKRERVKEDHLGVGLVPTQSAAPAAADSTSTSSDATAAAATPAPMSATNPPASDPPAAPAPAPAPAVVGEDSQDDVPPAVDHPAPADSSNTAPPPALPPRLPSSTVPAPSPANAAEEALSPPLALVEHDEAKANEKEEGEAK